MSGIFPSFQKRVAKAIMPKITALTPTSARFPVDPYEMVLTLIQLVVSLTFPAQEHKSTQNEERVLNFVDVIADHPSLTISDAVRQLE